MIQPYSRLVVADNSGARELMCITPEKRAKPNGAEVGDVITAVVKAAIPHAATKKKEVVKAVIVRQKKPVTRADGTTIRFDDNAAVLIEADGTPKGSRIFGPVARELRDRGYTKIISMAVEVL